jgi:3-phosphoshikimate 1-carboxyvinyltransferase
MSEDTRAAVRIYQALGAKIEMDSEGWTIQGVEGRLKAPSDILDVGNSGTTLRIALGSCSLLAEGEAVLTGDEQICRRPSGPLVASLNDLGASVSSVSTPGLPPFVVRGKLCGGTTTIEAKTSQYLTSLLINCPLADGDTIISVPLLNEGSYVEMTMEWMRRQGISFEHENMGRFYIPGGQVYYPFEGSIPADFSSATFFLAAGALEKNDIVCLGLDITDSQGDRKVVDYLKEMGAEVEVRDDRIRVRGSDLVGVDIDLNDTPDALPMMTVLGCFARGKTRLLNVSQARIKETDRIRVMRTELNKMGAKIRELPDGLEIEESKLKASHVSGHGDHRVVMALAVAGLATSGETVVDTAESAAITFPAFHSYMMGLGGDIAIVKDS